MGTPNLQPKLRFPEFTQPCVKKLLSELMSFKNGKGHEQSVVKHGKYEIVNSKFVSSEGVFKKFSEHQLCTVNKDDILLVMSDIPKGKVLGKTFLVDQDDKYTLNQRICSLTPIKDNSKY